MQGQVPYPKHPHHTREGNERSSGYRENFSASSLNLSYNSFQWNAPGGAGEEWKVHQQKLRVVYLPPEGQTVEEEEEEGHLEDLPLPAPSRFASDVGFGRLDFASVLDMNFTFRAKTLQGYHY